MEKIKNRWGEMGVEKEKKKHVKLRQKTFMGLTLVIPCI